jgi:transposase
MFIMGRTRRGFTPEYKDEAVKLVINTGRTVATVARELRVRESALGRWVHDFRARATAGEAGQGGLSQTERAELLQLRREN